MFYPYDVLLVCHPKDYKMLPFVVNGIQQNLQGYNKIHLVINNIDDVPCLYKNVIVHNEQEVLPVELNKIKHRPNWIYQQLIKLLQNITIDNYLVIDCDTIICKNISIYNDQKTPYFFFSADQYHEQYFKFIKKYFKIDKVHNHSFISEIMLFHRPFVKEMFTSIDLFDQNKIFEFFYNTITKEEYISEFELYGNFVMTRHCNSYDKKNINSISAGNFDHNFWNSDKISNILASNSQPDVITLHTWT